MAIIKFNANANAKKESNSEKAKALAKQLNEKADKKLKEEAQILIRDINVCLQSLQTFEALTEDVFPVSEVLADTLSTITRVIIDSKGNTFYNDNKAVELRQKAKKGYIKRTFPKEYKFVKENI